jgi:phage terminase small subunit
MTPKQQRFVEEYLIDLNGKQAAIRAGYSEPTAEVTASRLLSNVKVSAAVDEQRAKRAERTKIDADYVLNRLVEIDQMDVLDIMDDKMNLKPVHAWPPVWRRYLSGFDVAEMFEGRGDDREMVGILKKIKWPDKVKNLELLGKHVGVQAFKDKVEHSGGVTITVSPEDAQA